ncbi:ParB/RepB/Spo0J family partition protein [Methylocella sp.]|uniref:ParB/RepB/Spo0J family partition protein n=1 Tax=Methylocella sp. TaxID=1978226 RepID=UPI0037850318
MSRPKGLGRGLAALIGEGEAPGAPPVRAQKKAPIEFLRPNPRNPRRNFDEAELEDLAASIREKGLLQPILARPLAGLDDAYEIIAGERRWRAAQRAGLHEAPILVVEANDSEALELAIVENVQRSDLNALEEASGYERLCAEFDYSQGDLARVIGKSRSHIANTLRLLKLPERVKALLAEGLLSAGHARALLGVENPERLAERILADNLSVREVERIAQEEAAQAEAAKTGEAAPARASARREKDADTRALESTLSTGLGLRVTISGKGERGELRIAYQSLDQLDALCRRLDPSL